MILRVNTISQDNLLDLFMGTLKERIQHEVCLFEPKFLEHDSLEKKFGSKNMATRISITNNYRKAHNLSPKQIRLNPYQMYERRERELCSNFENKYIKGHKCSEKK